MTKREELLAEIIEAIDPVDEITEDTVIAESDDLDSLAMFNIVLILKLRGVNPSMDQLSNLNKVSDILDLVVE